MLRYQTQVTFYFVSNQHYTSLSEAASAYLDGMERNGME